MTDEKPVWPGKFIYGLFSARDHLRAVAELEQRDAELAQTFERWAANARGRIEEVFKSNLEPMLENYRRYGVRGRIRVSDGGLEYQQTENGDRQLNYDRPVLHAYLKVPVNNRRWPFSRWGKISIIFGENTAPEEFSWRMDHRDHMGRFSVDGTFPYPGAEKQFNAAVGYAVAEISPDYIAPRMGRDLDQILPR